MNSKIRKQIERRKRRIARRLDKKDNRGCDRPIMTASNIHYEIADRTRATANGGIGAMHLLVRKLELDQAIDHHLGLLKIHLPYHDSDHVLDIAYNLWFSWNWEAVELFIRLDPESWDKTYQNPALMLGVIQQPRFDELARDEGFLSNMHRVHAQFKEYMSAPTWFQKDHAPATGRTIAYFSLEYGIDVGLPIYSGGLGILSGDHLKSASDLGLPMVAISLFYRSDGLTLIYRSPGFSLVYSSSY